MTPILREQIKKHLSYTVTGPVLRLSAHTSMAAGYIDRPDATPLVPVYAVALRREIYFDAEVLSQSLRTPVEIHASEAQRSWRVGRISPSTAKMVSPFGVIGGEAEEVAETRREGKS
jgi:hypothetical protein